MIRCALLAWLLAACADDAVPGFTRETAPDGRGIVSYAAGLPMHEDTLVALFSVGKYVDDSSRIFNDLRDLDVGPDGRIYALDYGASNITVFDSVGTQLAVLGRPGEGPGELSQANGLRFGPDGTLWVNDHGKGMILALDTAGLERKRYLGLVPGFGYRWSVTIDTAGVLWESWSQRIAGPPPDMSKNGVVEGSSYRMFKTFDPATEVRDSVVLDRTTGRGYVASYGRGQWSTGLPFAGRAYGALDQRHRVWVSSPDAYTLVRMNAVSGDTTLEVAVAESGVPVTAADIAEWKESLADIAKDVPSIVTDLKAYLPDSMPPIDGLFADDRDRLWIERTVPAGDPLRWDLFTPEGEFLTTIRGPAGISGGLEPVVRRGRIYLVVNGDAGERYIVVAELPGVLR
ncbi:MAG: hypothetical protein ABI542_00715 [Gemmatimonadota bacterium]